MDRPRTGSTDAAGAEAADPLADTGHPTAGLVVAPVVEAMRAFAHERYDEAADGLEALRSFAGGKPCRIMPWF